ncbi:ABC transporter permease [Fructobacillus evanidus]|uniref:Permease component NatB (NatB) n=1 Tax=Fructobacillus evanidus TaxID=3064281 RepID=A0ABM9MP77_9LACO|nr:ABC-type Na+ efflux pump [Fructobacillus sp. LMG 32999]CAK1230342.1 ABC-type Na+ efflux pump [Fructobacillus sp. LMG 32999]CAK1234233.1 ABC-type Na+ efflux pump [Fructobacillus sp. LMG 32999]CAK1234335.1 ABC-type Na+ efflux pump [Fructobacillus sp. LMG 32999]CAK1248262.1 ABC-type Na+ efflux pump [Fructobacillus sp. LMG 32999]
MTNPTLLVAKHTYLTRLKKKSFWWLIISPILLIAAAALLGFGISYFSNDQPAKVAIIGPSTSREAISQSASKMNIKVSSITDEQSAQSALKKQTIDGILTLNDGQGTLVTQQKAPKIDKDQLQAVLSKLFLTTQAENYGLTERQTAALMTPFSLKTTVQNQSNNQQNTDNNQDAKAAISVAVTIIVLLIVSTYSSLIGNEIANEKSSRIMETLLAASSAQAQYFGKLLGITGLLVTQLLSYVVLGVGANLFGQQITVVKQALSYLTALTPAFLIYTLVYIIVATGLYLILAAIAASLVNDNSQVSQAMVPVTTLAMIPYVVGLASASNGGNNVVVRIFAYIPFMSQSTMPSLLANQYVNWWQALLSLTISLIALVALAQYGQKLYAKNVLSYSDENILKQLLASFKRS